MPEQSYTYIIVGAGLAGASAVEGIRELDTAGSVLLVGDEKHLPYDRPPLSKKLWFGKTKVEEIFVHPREFYDQNGVTLALGNRVVALDAAQKTVSDDQGRSYHFEKMLLATGGVPRSAPIPGSDLEGICYYRYLDDYLRIRGEAAEGKTAVIIGGGFIGSEIAAALNINKVNVTMVFPAPYLVDRVFPEYLGMALQDLYRERGIMILTGDLPVSFTRDADKYVTNTRNGMQIRSDLLIVGIGISPNVELAERAGLGVENGVVVNEYLQSSHPDVYSAGDLAQFPYQALGQQMRIEHWDNALSQGRWAGRNMAGAGEPFTYMPYFYSDLFEFGYEAVGEVNSQLATFADWQKENETGVIYYLDGDSKVRGVMLCNVWGKLDAARDLIRRGEPVGRESLRGAIS